MTNPPVPATPLDVEACVRLLKHEAKAREWAAIDYRDYAKEEDEADNPDGAASLRHTAEMHDVEAAHFRALASALPGMGKDSEAVAALTAENERLRSAMTEWAGMSGAVEIAISDLTNQSPWTALDVLHKARTFGDRARAALPSSRETTDG